jgi:dienelactone hydrolase
MIGAAMYSRIFASFLALLLLAPAVTRAQSPPSLPGTEPLTLSGDLSAQMVAGIDRFLLRETDHSAQARQTFWNRDFSNIAAYSLSVAPNRERFRKMIGAVDPRLPVTELEHAGTTLHPAKIAETEAYSVYAVRWPVFEGVYGEGLLLEPKTNINARVIALPDADQTPEMLVGLAPGIRPESQLARRLAMTGCQVIVPVLIDRDDTWSGNPAIQRFTNQPHREWIYRQAYQMGRHIIGYEVQKVLALVDWFTAENTKAYVETPDQAPRIGVAGFAEGGLLALYAAAADERIHAALVSGYFDSREKVWEEPIYRNVFGLLREFGDAEIATLIAPRGLVIEYSTPPVVNGPPPSRQGRSGAAPGKIQAQDFNSVAREVKRADGFFPEPFRPVFDFVHGNEGMAIGPGSVDACLYFLEWLKASTNGIQSVGQAPADVRENFKPAERQRRQVKQLEEFTQKLLRDSERVRDQFFWTKTAAQSGGTWDTTAFKEYFWNEVIGRIDRPPLPLKPRARQIAEHAKWTAYEVVFDVWPDVFAWGYLLVPKDLKPGERRPAVVCQHGLEGLPVDLINENRQSGAYAAYKAYAAKLAERGFITYAPHNPYRGRDAFRVLQRKANPLKISLFSIITAQHERTLDWLSELPFVDPQRIGFYGLSYGGKTAMRVPALLDRYALSICSADFNEWILKNVTVDWGYSYMFTGEYEMPEFDLGQTFNYAEMAAMIAPRPFMVERGHSDGVAPDEWVAYEFAKVRRLYARLGIPERTEIEFFNGPHTINGVGTFDFLHRHLQWPAP